MRKRVGRAGRQEEKGERDKEAKRRSRAEGKPQPLSPHRGDSGSSPAPDRESLTRPLGRTRWPQSPRPEQVAGMMPHEAWGG